MAQLVGVSFKWYSLFESGMTKGVSPRFVDRVSSVLRLSEFERDYLRTMLGLNPRPDAPRGPHVPDGLRRLVDAQVDTPACVYSRHLDILHANEEYQRLFGRTANGSAPERNKAWRIFTKDRKRGIWRDWHAVARHTVQALRYLNAADADSPVFRQLVQDLHRAREFARLWSDESLDAWDATRWVFGMQVRGIGTLDFQFVTLLVPDHPDLLLVVMVPTDAATAARMRRAMRRRSNHSS